MLFHNKSNLTGNKKTALTGKETIKLMKGKQSFVKDQRGPSPSVVPEKSSFLFDGVGAVIQAPINAAFDLDATDSFSFSAWVQARFFWSNRCNFS